MVKTYTYVGSGFGTHEQTNEEGSIIACLGCTRLQLWLSCIMVLVVSSLLCLALAFFAGTGAQTSEDLRAVKAGDQVVSSFVAGSGYSGPLKVTGFVKVTSQGTGPRASQVLLWKLLGTDPRCLGSDSTSVANSCGIHITSTSDCESEPGSNLHASNVPDPWGSAVYTVSGGTSVSEGLTVTTGLSEHDLTGHALIIYDHSGSRVACGIITATVPANR